MLVFALQYPRIHITTYTYFPFNSSTMIMITLTRIWNWHCDGNNVGCSGAPAPATQLCRPNTSICGILLFIFSVFVGWLQKTFQNTVQASLKIVLQINLRVTLLFVVNRPINVISTMLTIILRHLMIFDKRKHVTEFCPGNSSVCPLDSVAKSTVVCRAGNGTCDILLLTPALLPFFKVLLWHADTLQSFVMVQM